MPESFEIWPSEALLLGLCVEEYLCYQTKHPNERHRFLEILSSRLIPHVKSFRKLTTTQISAERCPPDIEWSGMFGRAKSRTRSVFATNNDGEIYSIQFDLSRRSLSDLLIAALWDQLSLTDYDRYFHAPTEIESANAIFKVFTCPDRRDLVAAPPENSESKARIQECIEALIRTNERDHVFDLGRRFGRLVYAIDDFEAFVWSIDESREQLIEEIRGEMASENMVTLDQDAEIGAQKEFEEWLSSNLQSLIESRPPDVSEEEWFEVVQRMIVEEKNAI